MATNNVFISGTTYYGIATHKDANTIAYMAYPLDNDINRCVLVAENNAYSQKFKLITGVDPDRYARYAYIKAVTPTLTISPTKISVTSGATSGTITLTYSGAYYWMIGQTPATWFSGTGSSSGTKYTYSISANTSTTSSRSTTIMFRLSDVSGTPPMATCQITQAAAPKPKGYVLFRYATSYGSAQWDSLVSGHTSSYFTGNNYGSCDIWFQNNYTNNVPGPVYYNASTSYLTYKASLFSYDSWKQGYYNFMAYMSNGYKYLYFNITSSEATSLNNGTNITSPKSVTIVSLSV